MSAKSVKDFQSFMINDGLLKSTGKCVNQVNLFALSNDKSNHGAKPNRIALVVVSYLSIFRENRIGESISRKIFLFIKDGEHCLDRLYGGYFPDWTCGGQWNNMMAFLTTLFTNCHHANVHLAVFLNGALEASRFQNWVQDQMKTKANVNQVLKHLTKRMTPPPKVFWVPPCSVKLMLRLAIRSLNGTIISRWGFMSNSKSVELP